MAELLKEINKEKRSFNELGITYEEKAFYDILNVVARKYEFEYPDDKMIELSKRIKLIVDDKSRYTDWSTRDDIKANLQVDLILLLDEFDYPPVTIDDVYKEVLEQAEIQIKYRGYIEREKYFADKMHRLEEIAIPAKFDYNAMQSLTIEARQKLSRIRPTTIGQASRIPGVSPADVSVLIIYLKMIGDK